MRAKETLVADKRVRTCARVLDYRADELMSVSVPVGLSCLRSVRSNAPAPACLALPR